MSASARLIGVGTGPGDPELITLKALRALERADVIAHFCKAGRPSHARRAVEPHLPTGVLELSLGYPVTTEIPRHDPAYVRAIEQFYDASAERVAAHLDQGATVAVLSEGDPFFYGSYMHLHVRLADRYPTQVIPGVNSPAGCWSQAGVPLMQGDDVLSIVPGTLPEPQLTERLAAADALVILKVGRHLSKVRRSLEKTGRLAGAIYVEQGTRADSRCVELERLELDVAPYFSLVLVPSWQPLARRGASAEHRERAAR